MPRPASLFDFNSASHILMAAALVCGLSGCSEHKPAGPPANSGAAAGTPDSGTADSSETARDTTAEPDTGPDKK